MLEPEFRNALLFLFKRDPGFFFSTPICTDLFSWLLSKRIKDSGSTGGRGNGLFSWRGGLGKSDSVEWKSHEGASSMSGSSTNPGPCPALGHPKMCTAVRLLCVHCVKLFPQVSTSWELAGHRVLMHWGNSSTRTLTT